MRNKIYLLLSWHLLFISITTATSCYTDSEDDCFGTAFEFTYTANLEVRDRITDDLLIGWYGRKYDSDLGIFLTDSDSNNVAYHLLDGVLRFDVYFDESGDLNALQEKTYFLDLPPWENNRNRDIDTLILTLGLTETNSICTSHRFNYLKFAYNGEVTFAGDPDTLDGREYLLGRK